MLPYFLNADGKYDPKLYNQVSNADKESLKNDIAKQLTWQRFRDDMFGSSEKLGDYTLFGLKSSEKESSFLASLSEEKRSFDTISFNKSDYPESEIKKFASENADLFDTYSLSMLTIKDESQVKKVFTQLTNNEITFEDAISEYSEKYYTDGDGKVTENFAYQIKENLEKEEDFTKISSLVKDSTSEIIKTNTGYSIYKCTGEKASANFEDAATIDAVKKYITTNKSNLIEEFFMEKANAFIADAKAENFANAAKKAGIEVVTLPAFPLNYGDISIADKLDASSAPAFANASSNENFLEKAFTMKVNDISEATVMGNYITVFHLTSIQNDKSDEAKISKINEELNSYDENSAQSALLSSSKVENKVSDVYFNKFLQR